MTSGRPSEAWRTGRGLARADASAVTAPPAATRSLDAVISTVGTRHGFPVAPLVVVVWSVVVSGKGRVGLWIVVMNPLRLTPLPPPTLATLALLHLLAGAAMHSGATRWRADGGAADKLYMRRPTDLRVNDLAEALAAATSVLAAR